jgi:uncharacterized SAM-binding protein YcdF (DUF218 family)
MIKKFLLALMVGVVIIVVIPLAIALYLSPQDELEKADVIVVISGGDTDARINEGVKMYFQKWAPKIIFSGAAATGDVSNALAMKRIAVSEGVPEKDILIEEDSKTTRENAEFSAEIIREIGAKKIILITSPYHQRRAYQEFKTVLDDEVKIINHSAVDENWRKKNWWEDPTARFLTFVEILKSVYSFFRRF